MLAAETGSGKTLAYLAPLTELALQKHRQAAAAAVAREEGAEAQDGEDAWHHQRHRRRQYATAALVLCPNVALCEQVLAAAQALRDPASGAPLAAAAFVSAQSPPPLSLPDVVITTPGALVSLLDNAGTAYGYEWTRAGRLLLMAACMPVQRVCLPCLLAWPPTESAAPTVGAWWACIAEAAAPQSATA